MMSSEVTDSRIFVSQIGAIQAVSREAYFTAIEGTSCLWEQFQLQLVTLPPF